MEEEYYEYYEEEENSKIDIIALIKKLLANWKKLLVWVAVAAVLGVVVAVSIPRRYAVSSKLAPEIVQKSGSSMSSLAALAGVNLNNMTVTDAMYPDLYPDIVYSVPFIVDLFSMPVAVHDGKEICQTDLSDYALHYTKSPWWSKVISSPIRLIGWARSLFTKKTGSEAEPAEQTEIDCYHLTKEQGKAYKAISHYVEITVDKKSYVITVTTETQDPKVSADLCQLVIDNLKKYVVNYRTEKARHDLEYYQQLYDQAQKEYYEAQQKYARYVDANQGVVFQRVLIERERLQSEASLKLQVYNTTAQQLTNAKAKVQMETPVCAVLQPPTIPLKSSGTSRSKILVAFMFLGLCFGSVWYLWGQDIVAKLRGKDDESETSSES